MSMYICNENVFNDVGNLIIKLYPYMDLKDVVERLIKLNIEVFINKYENGDKEKLCKYYDMYINNHDVINYDDEYTYIDKYNGGIKRFKDGYFNVQIIQLVESLSCYNYQIEEPYIKNLDNRFTYAMIKEIYAHPLIKSIKDFIQFNDLNNLYESDLNKSVKCVIWNR